MSEQPNKLELSPTNHRTDDYICRRCGRWVNSGHDSECAGQSRKVAVVWDEGREQAVEVNVGGAK